MAVARAQYLITTLSDSPEREESRAGREFLDWLERELRAIEPDAAVRDTILKQGQSEVTACSYWSYSMQP